LRTVRSGAATDAGLVRPSNQDLALEAGSLWAVADGMGGHAGGEVAARTAVDALAASFGRDPSPAGLAEAVRQANRAVWEKGRSDPQLRGMGTTMTAAALVTVGDDQRLALVNVGDSRAYQLRQGQLTQLTVDHSVAQEMLDSGELGEAEAGSSMYRHILTRALGAGPEVEVDEHQVAISAGDRILLCSDGLVNEVSEEEIARVLAEVPDPKQAASRLVALARDNGGSDNITAVVLDVLEGPDPGQAAPAELASREAPPARRRPRRRRAVARLVTARSVAFALALLVVVGAAVAAVGYFATRSYFVGLDHGTLVIYQGRPGGFLWFQPRVADRTGVRLSQVLPARYQDLRQGMEEPSLAAARRYVQNLVEEAQSLGPGPAGPGPTTPPGPPPS
jgi:serine/threonine protein phosphatase PrpC